MLIFCHSKIHEVFAEYQTYEGAPVFKFLIKWHFSRDTRFLKMCQDGANEESDMSNLEGPETVFLRRGAYLSKESCEILETHLATLLEFCYFENSALIMMTLEFVDFVVSDGKLRTYALLIFTVKVQRKYCISHQITAFKLHLDYSSVNSKIEEKSYKTLIFSQPKYCYWINVKIIFKNCKV